MITKCNLDASRRRAGKVSDGVMSNSELMVATFDRYSDKEDTVEVERQR
jgi:hypothetical protein